MKFSIMAGNETALPVAYASLMMKNQSVSVVSVLFAVVTSIELG